MTPEQEQKLNEVYEFIQSLKRSSSIPREIDQSFRERLLKNLLITYNSSEITPADRDQITSAGGGDLVPQVFTGLIKCNFDGVIVYIPYYQ